MKVMIKRVSKQKFTNNVMSTDIQGDYVYNFAKYWNKIHFK